MPNNLFPSIGDGDTVLKHRGIDADAAHPQQQSNNDGVVKEVSTLLGYFERTGAEEDDNDLYSSEDNKVVLTNDVC